MLLKTTRSQHFCYVCTRAHGVILRFEILKEVETGEEIIAPFVFEWYILVHFLMHNARNSRMLSAKTEQICLVLQP